MEASLAVYSTSNHGGDSSNNDSGSETDEHNHQSLQSMDHLSSCKFDRSLFDDDEDFNSSDEKKRYSKSIQEFSPISRNGYDYSAINNNRGTTAKTVQRRAYSLSPSGGRIASNKDGIRSSVSAFGRSSTPDRRVQMRHINNQPHNNARGNRSIGDASWGWVSEFIFCIVKKDFYSIFYVQTKAST